MKVAIIIIYIINKIMIDKTLHHNCYFCYHYDHEHISWSNSVTDKSTPPLSSTLSHSFCFHIITFVLFHLVISISLFNVLIQISLRAFDSARGSTTFVFFDYIIMHNREMCVMILIMVPLV